MQSHSLDHIKIEILPLGEHELPSALRLVVDVFNAVDEDKAIKELELYSKTKAAHIEYGHEYWIAKIGRRTVGIIGLEYVGKSDAWLSWFAVRREYRGKGIGSQLLEFATHHAQKKGVHTLSIECGTLPMFEKANKLYDEFGFKDKFTIEDFWAHNDDLLVKSKKMLSHRR